MMKPKYTEFLINLMNNEMFKPLIDESLSSYPIYTPEKSVDMIPNRDELNKKILNHFKYREIGFETPYRFVDELKITMNEIMPHYNELFKTIEIMHDLPSPFDNVDVTETFEETKTGSNESNVKSTSELSGTDSSSGSATGTTSDTSTINGTTNNTNNSKNVKSNTPQNLLNIGTTGINSVNYADEVSWNQDINSGSNNSTSTSNGESSSESSSSSNSSSSGETNTTGSNSTEETTKHTYKKIGNQGVNTYAHDMNEFRTSIIDVVNQILNDERLTELFMNVY